MTTEQFLTTAWDWNPWLIAVCIAAVVTYGALFGLGSPRRLAWLLGGLAILALTMASPIDALADGYLFSAHMLQHLLLLLIVPALVLLSLPPSGVAKNFHHAGLRWVARALQVPPIPWLLGVGGMWLWHAPALCNAAVANPWVHLVQSVSLVLMGTAFWWPIFGPWTQQRLAPLLGVLYLFSACVGCTILGIIITFAPVGVCSRYEHPVDRLGIMPLIQNQWGLTPDKDQQLGGLLMWVPACLIYLTGVFSLLVRWYSAADEQSPSPAVYHSAADKPKTLPKEHHA
jgi:putative membrane protein